MDLSCGTPTLYANHHPEGTGDDYKAFKVTAIGNRSKTNGPER